MDKELLELQIADLKAQLAAQATRKALNDKQYEKQIAQAQANLIKMQEQLAAIPVVE